ncbi:MAG: hypothetical protein ACHQKY_09735 [Terriglobia bacterium]
MKARRHAAIIVFIWLSCFYSSASFGSAGDNQVQYFPQLAFGGGYNTTWQFTGLGAGTSVVTVEFFAQNGLPLTVPTDLGTSNTFSFVLEGSASESVRTRGAGTQINAGWAKVTSTQSIGATETFRVAAADGNIICQAAVLSSGSVSGATVFAPDPRNTALAMVNVGSVTSTFGFNLIGKDGRTVASGSRNLEPASQTGLYVNQIPGLENTTAVDGSLEVTASQPFVLVTLEFEGRTFASAPVLHARIPTSADRTNLLDSILALKQGLDASLNEFLGPDPSDITPYADFLTHPDTGMTRLVPRGLYDQVLPIVGGGAYYSFVLHTHEYGHGSDISLEQSKLEVGFAGIDFGFLTDLGNTPIEQVGLDHPALQYLNSYVPPAVDANARAEQQRAGTGFTVASYYYRDTLPATPNTTYALRSISYQLSDVLVVFRIVRIDSDGSVILAWKKLATYAVPQSQ